MSDRIMPFWETPTIPSEHVVEFMAWFDEQIGLDREINSIKDGAYFIVSEITEDEADAVCVFIDTLDPA